MTRHNAAKYVEPHLMKPEIERAIREVLEAWETNCCASSVCDYVPNSNQPCADCPRKITMLSRCGLLQEAAAEVRTEGSAKPAEERAELEAGFRRRISRHNA